VVRSLPLFHGISPGSLADLEFLLKTRSVRDGEAVSFPADGHGVFGVAVRGTLKVQRPLPTAGISVVDVLGPGDIFLHGGCGPVLYGPHDEIVAMTTSCVLTMNLAELAPLLIRDSALSLRLFDQAIRRWAEQQDRLARVLAQAADQRLASLLLFLKTKGTPKPRYPNLIPFNITRRDLAASTGLSLETASRVLSMWEREGRLRSGRGWIELTDLPWLQDTSQRAD
jgi:CRP-like cAMP-binding protein